MSKFVTSIPVDVQSILDALPDNSFVWGVTWNPDARRVDVTWDHDDYKTPFTFPLDFPLASLQANTPPDGVTGPQKSSASVQTPEQVSVDPKAVKKAKR